MSSAVFSALRGEASKRTVCIDVQTTYHGVGKDPIREWCALLKEDAALNMRRPCQLRVSELLIVRLSNKEEYKQNVRTVLRY